MKLCRLVQLLVCTTIFSQTTTSPLVHHPKKELSISDYGDNFIDPVIFEPLPNIILSRSTFKVVGQVDFEPYFALFSRYEDFIKQLQQDMFHAYRDDNPFLDSAQTCLTTTPRVQGAPLGHQKYRPCTGMENHKKLEAEVDFIYGLFRDVKSKFYLAIDHVQLLDTIKLNTSEGIHDDIPPVSDQSRLKRTTDQGTFKKSDPNRIEQSRYMDLNKEELDVIQNLTQTYLAKNPKLRSHLKRRFKRFGIMSWVLGWGIFKNFRQSAQTKRNIGILQQQNRFQDLQIRELAKFVTFALSTLKTHYGLLHDIEVKLQIIKKQLEILAKDLQNLEWHMNYNLHVTTSLHRLTTGILIINEQVNKLYEYLRVMATHKLNPLIINPTQLKIVLKEIQITLRAHPRLSLPQDPDKDIWDYYSISRITPVVENGFLLVILTIPLCDVSLNLHLYKIHNLPSLHPDLKVEVNYVLEGHYLAVSKDKQYVALPTDREIQVCQVTNGYLCTLNSALYPIKKVEWCVYALFTKDASKITEYCTVDTKTRNAPRAINLGGFIWAISALVSENIFIRCVDDNRLLEIKSPLTILQIPSGCEGWNPSINIPAKTELTSSSQVFQDAEWFTKFNMNYQNLTRYGVWEIFNIPEITKLEAELYGTVLGEFPQFKIKYLKKQFDSLIDTSKVGLHPHYFIAIVVTSVIIVAIVVVLVMYKYGRLHSIIRAVRTNVTHLSPHPLPMSMTAKKLPKIKIHLDTSHPTPIPPPRKFAGSPYKPPSPTEQQPKNLARFQLRKKKKQAPQPPALLHHPLREPSDDSTPDLRDLSETQIRHLMHKVDKVTTRQGHDVELAQKFFAKKYLPDQTPEKKLPRQVTH